MPSSKRELFRSGLLDRTGAREVDAYDATIDANRRTIVSPRDRFPNRRVTERYDVMTDDDTSPAIVEVRVSEIVVCHRTRCDRNPGGTRCVHAKAVHEFKATAGDDAAS